MKKKMKKKAQVSIEFFFLFVILISILSIFLIFTSQIQRLTNHIISYNDAVLVAMKVGTSVNNVIGNPGLTIITEIPANYVIYHQPGAIIATNINSNISGSWPILYTPVLLNISENSTKINVSFASGIVSLIG